MKLFNYTIIILGIVLKLEGILMCLPLIVGIIYSEKSAYSYVITIAMCLIIGTILSHKKPKDTEILCNRRLHNSFIKLGNFKYIWLSSICYK